MRDTEKKEGIIYNEFHKQRMVFQFIMLMRLTASHDEPQKIQRVGLQDGAPHPSYVLQVTKGCQSECLQKVSSVRTKAQNQSSFGTQSQRENAYRCSIEPPH